MPIRAALTVGGYGEVGNSTQSPGKKARVTAFLRGFEIGSRNERIRNPVPAGCEGIIRGNRFD